MEKKAELKIGERVHGLFRGKGTIVGIRSDGVVVNFDSGLIERMQSNTLKSIKE